MDTRFILTKSKFGDYKLLVYKDNSDDSKEKSSKLNDIEVLRDYADEVGFENLMQTDRDYIMESYSRSKRNILDLALNNDFQWFVTFSFDRKKIDREDIKLTKKKFLYYINNYNKSKNVKLKYIAVPEWHADKKAIHFHCLMSGLCDLKYVGVTEFGHKDFRSEYCFKRLGSVTAIRIFDYQKFIAYYITKYVTKESARIFRDSYFRSYGLDRSDRVVDGIFYKYNDFDLVPYYENGMFSIYSFDDVDTIQTLIKMGALF